MTLIFREPNLLDKFLLLFGKKRAYKIPRQKVERQPHDYCTLQPENFFRALMRPANVPLPSGWIYRDSFNGDDEHSRESNPLKKKS